MENKLQEITNENEDDLYSRSCVECGGDMNTGGMICTHCLTIEAQNDKLHEEHQKTEKEAIRRFLNGEEPSWSHCCLHEDHPTTAGYGKLDDYGHWEYPLPEPIEQWRKKKDFDLKIKINGMKYKARIVPFGSDEIIKLNFIQFLCYEPTDNSTMEDEYNHCLNFINHEGANNMQEVLNLTSNHFTIGALVAMPRIVELQPKTHRQMMKFVKQLGSDTSFNIGPIRFIKDLISYHMPSEVVLDDQTNVPGLIETITNDCGIPVILESAKQKKWFRYKPNQEVEVLKLSLH